MYGMNESTGGVHGLHVLYNQTIKTNIVLLTYLNKQFCNML